MRLSSVFSSVVGLLWLGSAAACSLSTESAGALGSEVAANAEPAADSGAGGDPADASGPDAPGARDGGADSSPTDDILGTLASGACGVVRAELSQPSPSLEDNVLVFAAGESYDRASLSADGQRLYDFANAGGSSTESEVMSFEVLHYCEGAALLKAEKQISYQLPDDSGANSITDILVEIDGKKVGVSVTRAYRPASQPFTDVDVKALLVKKLAGVNRSSERVLPEDKWVKQILHVLSPKQSVTDAIGRMWPTIDPALRADTIVLVTQTAGGGFVYCDPDPPLGSECP